MSPLFPRAQSLAVGFRHWAPNLSFSPLIFPLIRLQEHNIELLREVQRAFIEWQILDLTKVYSKLFLVDLADQIYAKEGLGKISVGLVEEFVRDLVRRDQRPSRSSVTKSSGTDPDDVSLIGLEGEALRYDHCRPARRSSTLCHFCREPGRVPIQGDRGRTECVDQAE